MLIGDDFTNPIRILFEDGNTYAADHVEGDDGIIPLDDTLSEFLFDVFFPYVKAQLVKRIFRRSMPWDALNVGTQNCPSLEVYPTISTEDLAANDLIIYVIQSQKRLALLEEDDYDYGDTFLVKHEICQRDSFHRYAAGTEGMGGFIL